MFAQINLHRWKNKPFSSGKTKQALNLVGQPVERLFINFLGRDKYFINVQQRYF
jgi:hypothetical protein